MHTKIASLWRFIRTPVLLTSTTFLLISCASRNPLIDEVEQPAKEKSAVSATTDDETVRTAKANEPVLENTKPVVTKAKSDRVTENDNTLNQQPEGMKKWISKITPYKVDIQQGNFVSSEMLAKLKPGMTKEQVRFVLGTPLLTDMFHANRWDYLFRLQKPNGALTTNRVTVFFKENLVDRIVNDDLPGEAQYLSNIAGDKIPVEKPKKNSTDEYKAAEKKTADITEKTGATETVNAPDKQAGTSEPVKMAAPVEATKSVKVAEPVKTPDPVKVAEPAKANKPAKKVQPARVVEPPKPVAPVRVAEPVQAPAPASQPEPVSVPAKTTSQARTTSVPESTSDIKRPQRIKPVQTGNTEDELSSPENNIKTFEPISIPSRTGKMLPPSPNDQLIGNIQ